MESQDSPLPQRVTKRKHSNSTPSPRKTPTRKKESKCLKLYNNSPTPEALLNKSLEMSANEWKTDGQRPKPRRLNHKELSLVQCSVLSATETSLNRVNDQNRRILTPDIPTPSSTVKSIANYLNAKPAKLFIILNGAFRDLAFDVCKKCKTTNEITEALEGAGSAVFTNKAREATHTHINTLRATLALASEENSSTMRRAPL